MEQLAAPAPTVPLSTPPSYEPGPTLPHSTLVHVQVTECSTATDTHAAGAQDSSQSAVTADEWVGSDGPNTTHKDIVEARCCIIHEQKSLLSNSCNIDVI